MSDEQIIAKGKLVVKIETEAVSGLINSINKEFVNAVNVILSAKGRIVFTVYIRNRCSFRTADNAENQERRSENYGAYLHFLSQPNHHFTPPTPKPPDSSQATSCIHLSA